MAPQAYQGLPLKPRDFLPFPEKTLKHKKFYKIDPDKIILLASLRR
jgi:hypothetical protein